MFILFIVICNSLTSKFIVEIDDNAIVVIPCKMFIESGMLFSLLLFVNAKNIVFL